MLLSCVFSDFSLILHFWARQERSASTRSCCRKWLVQAGASALFPALNLRAAWLCVSSSDPGPTSRLRAAMSWLHKAWHTRLVGSQELPGNRRCRRQHIQHQACCWLRSCCQDGNIHPLHKSPSGPPQTESLESFSADGLISPVPELFGTTQKITQRPACCQDTQIYNTQCRQNGNAPGFSAHRKIAGVHRFLSA